MKVLKKSTLIIPILLAVGCSNQTGDTTIVKETEPLQEKQVGLVNSLTLQGEGKRWKAIYDIEDKTLFSEDTLESNVHADFRLTYKGSDLKSIKTIQYRLKMQDGSQEKGIISPQETGLKIKKREGQLNLGKLLVKDRPQLRDVVDLTIEWDGQSENFELTPPQKIEMRIKEK